jgi:hypothetical protein
VESSGGNAVAIHERLCEGLAGLETRRGSGRSEKKPTFLIESIGNAETEREFWPNHRKIHPFARSQRRDGRDVRQLHRVNRRNSGNSRIPRCAKHGHAGVRSEPRNEGVLAPATSKYQNSHCFSGLQRTS